MAMTREQRVKSWQAPSFMSSPEARESFCEDMVTEGEAWINAQSATGDIQHGIDLISGRTDNAPNRSQINTQRLKRNVREVVGTLSNIRPFWGYGSDASYYRPSAEMMNRVARAVYLESFFDRKLKGALQYMSVTGTGYLWPKYRRDMYGFGKGRIDFDAFGALDVLPVQMPTDNDLQEAYVVSIVNFLPVAKAHGMFPFFQSSLQPIAKRRYKGSTATGRRLTLAERFKTGMGGGTGGSRDGFYNLYSEIRYHFILDISVNTTGVVIPMGQKDTSWYYEVPYMGQEIRSRDPLTGEVKSRQATAEDARLYPYRRLMITTPGTLMYDGPAFDWHGMVPLVRFSADDWPWEGLGFSLTKDGSPFQQGINELERAAQTVANARLRPGMTYDISAGGDLNSGTAENLDPFAPDLRIGIDSQASGNSNPPLMPILPEHLLEVPAWFFALIEHYNTGMDYQLGMRGVDALVKMRANADANAVDKILEVAGPVIQDISRSMERSMYDSGNIVKYLILQYMTVARVIQYTGEDGITPETFDYDPDSLVPSHLPTEAPRMTDQLPSEVPKWVRARHFADNLRFSITPNSLHEITQMTRKLLLLQLKKAGIWIDSQTIAEACDVPNYGNIPGATVIERYWNEKEIELQHMARLQVMTGQAGPPGAGAGGVGGPPPTLPPPPQPVGRPNTDAKAPQLKQKGMASGGRSTITTS